MFTVMLFEFSEKRFVRKILKAYSTTKYAVSDMTVTGMREQRGKNNYVYKIYFEGNLVCEILWHRKNVFTYKRLPFEVKVEMLGMEVTTPQQEAFLQAWAEAMKWKWFYLRAVDRILGGRNE